MKRAFLRSTLIGLTLAILGSTCGFVFAEEMVATTPVPVDAAWWKDRHQAKLDIVKANQGNIDLVMIGDSITHGWEGGGKAVWEKFYAGRKPLNLGYGGDRTEHVLWRLDNGEVDGISPKLAVIMIGTNNVGHGSSSSAQTIEGIKAILGKLETKLPETKILLLAVFPRGADLNDGLRKQVNEINKGLPALADGKRVFFLDINDKFLDEDGVLPKSIMPDLLHPNAEGYQIWAEAVEPTVKKLMGEE